MPTTETISSELSALSQPIADLPRNNLFAVPDEYFNAFHINLVPRLHKEVYHQEAPELSPLLTALQKENPYHIPESYFNEQRIDLLPLRTDKKVFKMAHAIKYAAAACIAGLIATSFFITHQRETVPAATVTEASNITASMVSPDAIAMYLTDMDDFFIAETNENEPVTNNTNLLVDIDPSTIKEILQEIPINDISIYMDQNGFGDVNTLN